MINCHYCHKEIKEDKKGNIRVAFIPETRMTVDFPICNDWCLKRLRLEREYDKSKTKKEKKFMLDYFKKERLKDVQHWNRKIKEVSQKG